MFRDPPSHEVQHFSQKSSALFTLVHILRWKLREKKQSPFQNHVSAILQIPTPISNKQMWRLLGVGRNCSKLMMVFSEMAGPLYESNRVMPPYEWTKPEHRVFTDLCLSRLSLVITDITKPFHLYMDESRGLVCGNFVQTLGKIIIISVQETWSICTKMASSYKGHNFHVSASKAKRRERRNAYKLNFGCKFFLTNLHSVEAFLKCTLKKRIFNICMTQYHALLLN